MGPSPNLLFPSISPAAQLNFREAVSLTNKINKTCSYGTILLGTLFDLCRLAYLTYTSNDCVRPRLTMNFPT
jgi:hypothetical protein